MSNRILKVISILLIIALCVSLLSACGSSSAPANVDAAPVPVEPIVEEDPAVAGLTDEQKASMAMLYYLAYEVEQIHANNNSRAVLEEVSNSITNDVEPGVVDAVTLEAYHGISNTVKQYHMNQNAYRRLQYYNDQSTAAEWLKAIPDPEEFIEALKEKGTTRALASAAYKTLGVVAESTEVSNEELMYLQQQWKLEDSEIEVLMDSKQNMFEYLVQVAQDLPKGIILNANDISEFVKHTTTSGAAAKLDWLKTNQEKYQYFGYYWLELADAYYETGDYSGCLSAIATYMERDTGIFRYDRRLAQSLPKAIESAKETMTGDAFEKAAAGYTDAIVENIAERDWELRQYAVTAYTDLYNQTGNKEYLEKAFEQSMLNVRFLVAEQKEQNQAYLADIKDIDISKDAAKEEQNVVKNYTKYLKDQRKKELIPVYQPLLQNCEMLFALAEELDISQEKKDAVDSILHDEPVFLSYALDQRFSFSERQGQVKLSEETMSYTGVLKDQKISLPVVFAPAGTQIKAVVKTNGKEYKLDEWTVHEVDRKKSKTIGDFEAVFTAKTDDIIKFSEGDTVDITLIPPGSSSDKDNTVIKLVVDKANVLGVHFKQLEP